MNNIQRNEPCPCGSGKKYKNCCMRKDEAKAQLSKQTYDVRNVIGPNTTPYMFWKRWSVACNRNEFGLVHDMLLPGGQLSERFKTADDFFVNLNEIGLPYEERWTLDAIKLMETGKCMFLCHRVDSDNKNADVVASLMTLQRTDLGYRVENIERKICKREGQFSLDFSVFGVQSAFGDYNDKLKSGWTRPDLTDASSRFVAPAE